ncbi:hypothetical protein [Chryseobacterium sp. POE27]|uniref:hypothetical protein n=1 Tax=Chryseobacterium sp. POE27 TaxID=3138177 RepID=UPI00321A073B
MDVFFSSSIKPFAWRKAEISNAILMVNQLIKLYFPEKYCSVVATFLENNKVHIIAEIHHDNIGDQNRNYTYNRPLGCRFRPGKLFVEKIINQAITNTQNKGIHERYNNSKQKISHRFLICKNKKRRTWPLPMISSID